MIYNLGIIGVGFSVEQAIRTLFGTIAALLYNFIVDLYNIFHTLSTVNVVDNEYVQKVYNRVGMILGLFMLFKLVFSLIQSVLDTSKINDKKNGAVAIVKRSVISIVLLGVTPAIFGMAFDLQKVIVGSVDDSSNVLYRFISDETVYVKSSSFGMTLAADLFFSFYKELYDGAVGIQVDYNDEADLDNYGGKGSYYYRLEDGFDALETSVRNCDWTTKKDANGYDCTFRSTVEYLSLKKLGKYAIEWDSIFSIVVAIIVIWMLAVYCIQVAIRSIQLAYLQLIAPVPILSYISDSEGIFKKWTDQCVSTYLDLFMRLLVIYFVMTMCTKIVEIFDPKNIVNNNFGLDPDLSYLFWIKIFMIIGLLLFAKKVPDLLKDLFPNMGGGAGKFDFGLKAPKEVSSFVKGTATLGAGVAIGGVAGMASGIRHGEGWRKWMAAPGGFIRGVASARTKGNIFDNAKKGMANVRNVNAKAYERHHDGSTFFGRMTPILAERNLASFEKELQSYNDYDSVVSFIDKELEKNAIVQSAMDEMQRMRDSGLITTTLPVMAGGRPVIDKKTGRPAMKTVTRAATEADYEAAQKKIKDAKENALRIEIDKGDDVGLMSALANAEAIRNKGVQNGYVGYKGSESITDSSRSSSDRAKTFFSVKKETKGQTQEIQGAGGSRNKEYKRAKANSKYKPGGK